jgi:hypothetical protein
MMTLMDVDESGATRRYYASEQLTGPAPTYAALLTAVLKQLHGSKFNHEYDVHGICNPFLQVKVRSHPACMLGVSFHKVSKRPFVCCVKTCAVPFIFVLQTRTPRVQLYSVIDLSRASCTPLACASTWDQQSCCTQVLKCLALLGKGSADATEAMSDTLAKVRCSLSTFARPVRRIINVSCQFFTCMLSNTCVQISHA